MVKISYLKQLLDLKIILNLLLFTTLLNTVSCNNMTTFKLNNEKRLIQDLFKNYKVKFGRPVKNMTEKVVVYFGITLIQLIDLDEIKQVLISNVHALYRWNDNGLKWNKSEYGGIEDIRLPVGQIWTPDIVLYNYADTRLEEKREVLAIVSYDGTVRWRPPSIFKSTCSIDIEKFPYDQQNCTMKFGSWTYDGDAIDIQFYDGVEKIILDEYTPSNEWEIIQAPGKRNEKYYACCKEPYLDITFMITMKRRGGFYNYILVLPCVLLSCLTTVLFWLPPESPAKMVLGMNIFTSFFVLLLLLSKNIPSATDKIPLIGSYYCLNMVMIATSTCACTVVVHIFFRGQGRVPYILRKIFLEFLARIFCMITPPVLPPAPPPSSQAKKAGPIQQQPATIITSVNNPASQSNGNLMHHINRMPTLPTSNNRLAQLQANSISCSALNNTEELAQLINNNNQPPNMMPLGFNTIGDLNDEIKLHHSLPYNTQTLPSHSKSPYHAIYQPQPIQHIHTHQQSAQLNNELNLSFNLIENDIKEIRDYLRHTRKKFETTDAKGKQTNEWKQVALVLDRTLFFIYIIAIIVSVTLMFPR